jgi:hypothetical protein
MYVGIITALHAVIIGHIGRAYNIRRVVCGEYGTYSPHAD